MTSHLTVVRRRLEEDLRLLPISNMCQNHHERHSNRCLMRKNPRTRTKTTAKSSTPNRHNRRSVCSSRTGSISLKKKNCRRDKSRSRCRSRNRYHTNRLSHKSKNRLKRLTNPQHIKAISMILQLMPVLGIKMQNSQMNMVKWVV